MSVTILSGNSFKTTRWAGGNTTELYIYPETSTYAARDFNFRLSTATVEVNESEFTPLPGISRQLLVLEGEIELQHEGHHSIFLHPGESDSFEGGWKTRSIGKCVDFNLMMMQGTRGELFYRELARDEQWQADDETPFIAVYVYRGQIEIGNSPGGSITQQGELVLIQNQEHPLGVNAVEESIIVVVGIAELSS